MLSLTGFTALIVISLAGAGVLMVMILVKFILEFRKKDLW
jgi:hypothetical protein